MHLHMCTDLKAAHGHILWGMISLRGPKGTILSDPDRGLFILEENPVCKDTLQSASSHSLLTHKHTDTGFIHPTVRLNMRLYASFPLHTRTIINAQKVYAMPGIHMLMHTRTLHCSFLRSLRLALKYRRLEKHLPGTKGAISHSAP